MHLFKQARLLSDPWASAFHRATTFLTNPISRVRGEKLKKKKKKKEKKNEGNDKKPSVADYCEHLEKLLLLNIKKKSVTCSVSLGNALD